MRSLFSLLAAVALLALVPARGWAEDHGHCEEPTGVAAAPAEAPAAAPDQVLATPGPCDRCPDDSCPSQGHCAVVTPPVIAEASVTQFVNPAGAAAGPVTTTGFAVSFDPVPPTPPPNLRTL